ncbi:hypothetical protein [Blastococcus saxobsidens]|nr:hypothetical protein [Blastococcus saxobsidens]
MPYCRRPPPPPEPGAGGQAGIDAFTELRWKGMQVEPRVHPF